MSADPGLGLEEKPAQKSNISLALRWFAPKDLAQVALDKQTEGEAL